jgi:acetyltransferase-like isoleucine patch superfamily enzyme
VCIVPGTVVGEGAIIGMGTVLSGEIPPMSIVVGSRWRVVGTRDAAHYEDCVKRQAFGGPNGMRLAGEIAPS